jgi:phage baseplate assembly protein W
VVCSFPVGSRIEKPDFGVPDQTFAQGGAAAGPVLAAVNRWEPRAQATAEADQSSLAEFVSTITVEIGVDQ